MGGTRAAASEARCLAEAQGRGKLTNVVLLWRGLDNAAFRYLPKTLTSPMISPAVARKLKPRAVTIPRMVSARSRLISLRSRTSSEAISAEISNLSALKSVFGAANSIFNVAKSLC